MNSSMQKNKYCDACNKINFCKTRNDIIENYPIAYRYWV